MKKLNISQLHRDFVSYNGENNIHLYLLTQNKPTDDFMTLEQILNLSYISNEFRQFVKDCAFKVKVEELLK